MIINTIELGIIKGTEPYDWPDLQIYNAYCTIFNKCYYEQIINALRSNGYFKNLLVGNTVSVNLKVFQREIIISGIGSSDLKFTELWKTNLRFFTSFEMGLGQKVYDYEYHWASLWQNWTYTKVYTIKETDIEKFKNEEVPPLPLESNDWIKSHEFHKKIADNTPSMIIRKWAKDQNGNKTNTVLEKVVVLGGITTALGFKAMGTTTEVFHETATNTILSDTYKRVASVDGTRLNSIVNEAKKAVMSQKPVSELGKITPKNAFAFAQGSSALMSTLGFVAKLGKYVMPLASFLSISKPLGTDDTWLKEFDTADSLVTAKKYDQKAYDEAIKEYWEEKLEEYESTKDKDTLPDDEAELKEQEAKEKEEEQKQIQDLQKQILTQEAKRKSLKSNNKDWAEQDLNAYEKQFSDKQYSPVEGVTLEEGYYSNSGLKHQLEVNNIILKVGEVEANKKLGELLPTMVDDLTKPKEQPLKGFKDIEPSKRITNFDILNNIKYGEGI